MKLTVFILMNAAPAWLRLDRRRRAEIADAALAEAFSDPAVSLRHFDAEAFCGRFSDVAVIEAETPEAYYFAIERLRDTPLIAEEYFRVAEIIPAYENGFRAFENTGASNAA